MTDLRDVIVTKYDFVFCVKRAWVFTGTCYTLN